MKLLLASQSKARRVMLKAAGVPFNIADQFLDESAVRAGFANTSAAMLADFLAEKKAAFVQAGAGVLVLGSDQTLECEDGSILAKPTSREDAFAQLHMLSGKSHQLHSAAVIYEEGRPVWRHIQSARLVMRQFSDAYIHQYLDHEYETVRYSVGCYHIEGAGVQMFDHIEGDHFVIRGLPLFPLLSYLREREIIPL